MNFEYAILLPLQPPGLSGCGHRILLRVDRAGSRLRRNEVLLPGTRDRGTVGRRLPLRVLHVRLRPRHAGPHCAGMLISPLFMMKSHNPDGSVSYRVSHLFGHLGSVDIEFEGFTVCLSRIKQSMESYISMSTELNNTTR